MMIRSLIERPGGSRIDLNGKIYHFRPIEPNGPHVAEVIDKAHVKRLLSITEGYEAEIGDEEPGDDYETKNKAALLALLAERTGKPGDPNMNKASLIEALRALDDAADDGQ